MRPERVVIGIDFDDASLEAARWVIRHLLPDSHHILVHALDVRDPPPYLGLTRSDDVMEEGRQQAIERLANFQEEVQDSSQREVRKGRPDEVLSQLADGQDAGLIAVGRGSGGGGLLGATAERLVNAASVPVLMIPDAPGAAPGDVLVAVDDTPETADVLAWARSVAERHDATATVLHVFQPTFAGISGVLSESTSRQEVEREQREQARAWLEEEVGEAGFALSRVDLDVREGDPATQILDASRTLRPDLIITGSRGPGAVEKALLGSVASSVLRDATQPVLVVRR